jgi:hypothetical protein
LSTSNCFPTRSVAIIDVPVRFPPGCARLETSPLPTGSITIDMMMGIVLVACWAALVAAPPLATMADQIRCESGVLIVLSLGPAGLEDDGLAFDIAQLA